MRKKMRKINNLRYILPVYLLLLLVMFILPFYSAEGYLISKNTTSHLGAQNTPNAWIMNITFSLLGLACMVEAWFHLKKLWFQKILLSIFGLALIFIAIFQHAPIVEGIPYSELEDNLHSVFALAVGFSFTVFAFSIGFFEKRKIEKIFAISVGLIAPGLSLLIFYVADYSGLWQRMIFIITFAWLIFLFEGLRRLGEE